MYNKGKTAQGNVVTCSTNQQKRMLERMLGKIEWESGEQGSDSGPAVAGGLAELTDETGATDNLPEQPETVDDTAPESAGAALTESDGTSDTGDEAALTPVVVTPESAPTIAETETSAMAGEEQADPGADPKQEPVPEGPRLGSGNDWQHSKGRKRR